MVNTFDIVKRHYQQGDNIIPIRTDGSKVPLVRWKQYKQARMPFYELERKFTQPAGIGMIMGYNNHFIIDFDHNALEIFPKFYKEMPRNLQELATIVRTPKPGYHLHFKTDNIPTQEPLAKDINGAVLIEIISRQHSIMPGSHLNTHHTGKPYTCIKGDQFNIHFIDQDSVALLVKLCLNYNQYIKPIKPPPVCGALTGGMALGTRPGDIFNANTSWADILEPHGWVEVGTDQWLRPGKHEGISATTNWDGRNYLYCFSTSTAFESHLPYSKFCAYALLNFDNDLSAASKYLYRVQVEELYQKLLKLLN